MFFSPLMRETITHFPFSISRSPHSILTGYHDCSQSPIFSPSRASRKSMSTFHLGPTIALKYSPCIGTSVVPQTSSIAIPRAYVLTRLALSFAYIGRIAARYSLILGGIMSHLLSECDDIIPPIDRVESPHEVYHGWARFHSLF